MLILHNSVICLECGEKLVSRFRHDYKTCGCENETSVDGGLSYQRYGGKDLEKVQPFLITEEDDFDTQRRYFEWGTRGKDGKEELKYVRLKDISDEHLDAILEYIGDKKPFYKIFKKEKRWRKSQTKN